MHEHITNNDSLFSCRLLSLVGSLFSLIGIILRGLWLFYRERLTRPTRRNADSELSALSRDSGAISLQMRLPVVLSI